MLRKSRLWLLMVVGIVAIAGMAFALGPEWKAGAREVQKDVIDTAIDDANFDILITLLGSTGLHETLRHKGPYTVFAPLDEAFEKLPPGALPRLLMDDNREMLHDILAFHVVPGRLTVKEIQELDSIETVNGQSVSFSTRKWTLFVDNARIIRGDMQCKNGILHVIDSVLLPRIELPR